MENIQQTSINENVEPTNPDNSTVSTTKNQGLYEGGETNNVPQNNELILGKFKSVEDLSKAYTELQKQQGKRSQELGELRKNTSSVNSLESSLKQILELKGKMSGYLDEYKNKYDKPEYFQNQSFRNLYKEAFKTLGTNLDTDKFIGLLEDYTNSRINSHEKNKSALKETENILDNMNYEKNPQINFSSPKKRFDEMTSKEIDEMLERLI